jgi:sugar/nucleoside kinase (ribokinase family)
MNAIILSDADIAGFESALPQIAEAAGVLVMTQGAAGAVVFQNQQKFHFPAFPVKEVDATGAGDGFTTAYIAGLFYGLPHAQALKWGPVNAGSVVQKIGPQAGLLNRQAIELKLKKLKKFETINITDVKSKKQVMAMVAKKKD